jgi:hypothetical protein
MPTNRRRIAVHLAAAMIFAAVVARAEPFPQVKPDSPPPGGVQVKPTELPKTFTTPGNAKATVVSSTPKRLRVDVTAPSGASSAVTIVGPPTVLQKSAVEAIIDFAISLLDKVVTGGGKSGQCTQTITTTTTGGMSTTTITTKCTSAQ